MKIEKPTLAEKQAFWAEQLPLFKEAYWLPEHFELLKFDMEEGNFVVRDDIDPDFGDDADDLYHRINTGWSMWKRAVNHMQKNLEGCVVVPEDQAKDTARLDFMLEENKVVSTDINCDENYERTDEGFCVNAVYWIDGWDRLTTSVHKTKREAIDAAMVEAARGGNHD